MYLLKIGPVAALVLSGVALFLLALAPLGWRIGLWQYGFGLYWMMPVSGFVAAVAVIISVLTLARDWSQLRLHDLAMLFIALALGAALVYVPGQYWYTRNTVPPIHDITTDLDNPPTFSAVLAARAAERAGSVDNRSPQLAQMQKAAYPDLVPVMTTLPVTRAFNEALDSREIDAGLDHRCLRCRCRPHRGEPTEPLVPLHRRYRHQGCRRSRKPH